MFLHEFLDAFRQSRTVARAAAERGVTVQQLADALQVSTQLATLLMTGSQPPTTAEPPTRPTFGGERGPAQRGHQPPRRLIRLPHCAN